MRNLQSKRMVTAVLLTTLVLFAIPQFSHFSQAAETITIWYMEDEQVDDTLIVLIDEFETTSGITVNVEYKSPETLRMDYKVAYVLGNAPDLIQGKAEWISDFSNNEMIVPIAQSDFQEEYMGSALRAVAYFSRDNGQFQTNSLSYYGFPQSVDTMALIYNVDEATTATIPETTGTWTTAEFQSQITKMNDQSLPSDKQFGFTFIDMLNTEETLFLGAGGVMFSNYTLDQAHNEINSDASTDALVFLYDFVNTYRLTPSYKTGYYVNEVNQLLKDLIYEDFAVNGNVSSTMLYASQLKELTSVGIFSDSAKLGIAPVPVDNDGTEPFLKVNVFMISSQSANQEEAMELAQFLSSADAMKENAKNENILPAIQTVYDDAELATNAIVQAYKPLVEHTTGIYLSRFWFQIEEHFDTQVTTVIRGGQTGETCAAALNIAWMQDLLPNADTPGIGEDISFFFDEGVSIAGPNTIYLVSILGLTTTLLIFSKKFKKTRRFTK